MPGPRNGVAIYDGGGRVESPRGKQALLVYSSLKRPAGLPLPVGDVVEDLEEVFDLVEGVVVCERDANDALRVRFAERAQGSGREEVAVSDRDARALRRGDDLARGEAVVRERDGRQAPDLRGPRASLLRPQRRSWSSSSRGSSEARASPRRAASRRVSLGRTKGVA